MVFYFTIIDSADVETPIDDPVGWDSTILTLDRDRDAPLPHGITFNYQANPYIYEGDAYRLLKAEYELNGIEGEMFLRVEFDCGGGVEELGTFRFVFAQYDDSHGSGCAVSIPVEDIDEAVIFRNRIDQKVDLFTDETFDGTGLSTYTALPFTKTLTGKNILLQDSSNNPGAVAIQYLGDWFDNPVTSDDGYPDYGLRQMIFSVPGFSAKVADEIGGYVHPSDGTPTVDVTMQGSFDSPIPPGYVELPYGSGSTSPDHSFDRVFPVDQIPPIINYSADLGADFGPMNVTIEGRYKKTFQAFSVFGVYTSRLEVLGVYLGILRSGMDPYNAASWNWLSTSTSVFDVSPFVTGTYQTAIAGNFTFSFNITLNPGDRVYYFDKLGYRKKDAYNSNYAMFITNQDTSYFKVFGFSTVADTTAKLFMINEALSRVTEAITDDRLRVYSDYYGRTDSQPYTAAADGCGSHLSITQGKLIRRLEAVTPDNVFALSFKDLWEGINPIDNIGAAIEPDPARPGFNRLRVEDWRFFYDDDVILSCTGVDEIKRTSAATDHVSVFKFGYAKWEAEKFNGIDEIMTMREYRTELTQVNSQFSQISTFIAAGYTIEIGRRLGNTTTEDWTYDDDTFVVQMKRDSGVLIPQVGDIDSPANILDPDTIYNFKIRPSTMAMRWLPHVLASYRQATTSSKIIFTNGTGNYNAEGELSTAVCIIEGGVISEKQDLAPLDMATPTDGMPVKFLENVAFKYPITVAQFKTLKASPHKRIYFENEHTNGFGWIRSVEFAIADGIATFNLIPSR